MAQAWRLAIAFVLVPLSLLASPARSGKPAAPATLGQLAGAYRLGDGLGFNFLLTLTLEGTFSYQWQGCMGTYAEASGKAFLRDGDLVLEPSFLKGETKRGFKTRFHPILWGDRVYLVPPDELSRFALEIKKGREPRSSSFGDAYLRVGDWKRPVTGTPDLPEQEE